MSLGSPHTSKNLIGTFEMRLGPLLKAGLLAPKHSIGLIDAVGLNFELNSVDLMGEFPQFPVDTAVTSFITSITPTFREFSKRNLDILFGNSPGDYPTAGGDVVATVVTTSAIAADATAISLTASPTPNFTVGDVIVVYDTANPSNVAVSVISAITGTDITLTTGMGLAVGFAQGATVKAYKADPIGIGNITTVNYFSVQLIQLDRSTSRPVVFDGWKCALSGGSSPNFTVTEFASGELPIKLLKPSAADLAGDLSHMASQIAKYPLSRWSHVPDIR